MVILATSDVHAQNRGMFAKPLEGGITTRALTTFKFLNWLGTQNADAYIIAGDLFSQKNAIPTPIYNRMLDCLISLCEETPVIAIPGNHDRYMESGDEHSLYALSHAIENFTVLGTPAASAEHGDVEYVGYPAGTAFFDKIPQPREKHINTRILIIHENIIGAQFPSGREVDAGVAPADVFSFMQTHRIDFTICGDIHKGQMIFKNAKGGYTSGKLPPLPKPLGRAIWLPGAPFQMDFGDEGHDKGVLLFNTTDQDVQFLDYPYGPEFITVDDKFFTLGGTAAVDNVFYRFQVDKCRDQAEDFVREHLKGRAMVEYKPADQEKTVFTSTDRRAYRTMVSEHALAKGNKRLEKLCLKYFDEAETQLSE